MADSKLSALTAISSLSDSDLFYVVQNGTDYKMTNAQLLNFAKGAIVVPITQTDYDALTPAQKANGSIYIITDADFALSDLSDVNAPSPNTGDVLMFDGNEWVEDSIVNSGVVSINQFIGAGYITGSRNYIDFSIPLKTKNATSISVTGISSQSSYYPFSGSVVTSPFQVSGSSVLSFTDDMAVVELRLASQASSVQGAVVNAVGLQLTIS